MLGTLLAPGVLVALFAAAPVLAQGVTSRGVSPTPRGKPSGIPLLASFTDVAAESGLRRATVYGENDHKDFILETIGGGAAWIDFDGDGWLDLLLMGGTRFGADQPSSSLQLYRGLRGRSFEDVTEEAGLDRVGWASSATVGDFDNDGHEDVFITFWGQNALYRNRGDGRFLDVTGEAGLLGADVRWGAGATFLDFDGDGWLDLFVSNYLRFDPETAPRKGSGTNCTWKGVPVNCGPRGLPMGRHSLYRNLGDGTFEDVTGASGIGHSLPGYGMTAVAADLDADGWVDIYLACDGTPSLLFRNQGDGTFREEGLERGVALSEDAVEQAGMGVGIGDYDLDGDLDLFKTHFSEDTNVLYRNDGSGLFEDDTVEAGLGVETRFVGWGAAIADLDNDGWPDLAYVTGSVYPEVEASLPQFPYRTPNVVFRNLGDGRFEEFIDGAGPGMAAAHSSRGAAFGDYDNDGDIDIVVVNMNEPPSLLRNDIESGRKWLRIRLRGSPGASNRSAIGAVATLYYAGRAQAQAVTGQSSFYSVDDLRLHFGLGDARSADLAVRWPSGAEERFERLAAGKDHVVWEGTGILQ